ncbi:hypothetical protein MKZ17_20360 [Solibacillus sp. FSL R7-0682]|uniref:hypothetical protein n=1 Tax=Solibacillus sp. FSL R7-0682 TaxID=2921690 RepID=UPI0030F8F19A
MLNVVNPHKSDGTPIRRLHKKLPNGFRGAVKICPLDFEVEYKHIKYTKSITVKRNGTFRTIENESVREDIPGCFFNKSKFDLLLGMDEGEGRNQALFKQTPNELNGVNGWQDFLDSNELKLGIIVFYCN